MVAEYIIALEAVKEEFWFKKLIAELDVMSLDVVPLFYNNNDVIALAKKLRSHQKSKHIERWIHLIHKYLEKKFVKVQRVNSIDNVTDLLTKSLSQ